jgi:predicted nucleic acid-binding protein
VISAVLDTSVLVRYLTRDDPGKADAARALIAGAGDASLLFPGVALAELAFVLLRVYRWPSDAVANAIRAVVSHLAIEVPETSTWLDVADDVQNGRGIVDAYLMRTAAATGVSEIITFDTEMKPIAGVTCREP